MNKIESADGTRIAYELSGEGPPVILIGGALSDREYGRPLAEALSARHTVVNFDRRGRGESTDAAAGTFPEGPERELEDVAALLETVGGEAAVYGHSSGAALALEAAATLPVNALIAHEPPYHPDGEVEGARVAAKYNRDLRAILAEGGREDDAVELFFAVLEMPDEVLAEFKRGEEWARWRSMGATLGYDSAAVGDAGGGGVPHDLLSAVTCPTLTLAGSNTFPFMVTAGEQIADELADGRFVLVDGADHESGPDLIAPPVLEFLAG